MIDKFEKTISEIRSKLGMVAHVCNSSYSGGGDGRTIVQSQSWAKNQDPI
jgi:hypothetical protein